MLNLSSKKAIQKGDTPAKILKQSMNAYLTELTFLINKWLEKGFFPDDLKLAEHLFPKRKVRPQLVENLVIVIRAHLVKVYNNYASTLIIYKVNFFFNLYFTSIQISYLQIYK